MIILIVDRVGRLPATIFSRCQRLNFLCPAYPDSLEWLNHYHPGAPWPQALQASNGAPLAAVAALERLDDTASMAREWIDIAERRGDPLSVAERWSKYEPEFVLGWLGGQVQAAIQVLSGDSTVADASVLPDTVLRRIDRRNLFCYLDLINRLRGQAMGSYNVRLTFESLLIDWAKGLTGMYDSNDNDVSGLSFMSGSHKR